MYEDSFGLKRRPFAATPDATCFLSAGPIQAAFDEIVVCIEQGQGIAVLTAPAGMGKTLFCERLCVELDSRFQTVFLRHGSFLTRRALLQTLLSELDHSYHHPSEQELRLELFPAIRDLRPHREALVVICDEAHELSDSLIEELRILADFAESGRPLVRLVLVGQLSLEEKLAQPRLEAFNQRIRAHVNLPTFDRAGSLDYIDYRLTWGGGRTDEIFTPAALDAIVRASDGIPRCINQLADHSLLLGFVAEQRPVGEQMVREALHDLRQLPLQWNEVSLSHVSADSRELSRDVSDVIAEQVTSRLDLVEQTSDSNPESGMHSYESTIGEVIGEVDSNDHSAESVSFEIGVDTVPTMESQFILELPESTQEIQIDVTSDDWREALDLFTLRDSDSAPIPIIASEVDAPNQSNHLSFTFHPTLQAAATHASNVIFEEIVIDRYASIDAGLPPVAMSNPDTFKTTEVREVSALVETPAISLDPNRTNSDSFDHDAISQFDMSMELDPPNERSSEETPVEPLEHVLGFVRDLIGEVSEQNKSGESLSTDSSNESSSLSENDDSADSTIFTTLRRDVVDQIDHAEVDDEFWQVTGPSETAWETLESEPVASTPNPRPFRYLFTVLRRKQQQANEALPGMKSH